MNTMYRPELKAERPWLIALAVILAISSLGFAVLNVVLGPMLPFEQQKANEAGILAAPKNPELETLAAFWAEKGFDLIWREKIHEVQRSEHRDQQGAWIQGRETWVLVPSRFDQNLRPGLMEICGRFLEEGWLIQIEASAAGFDVGFWSEAPQFERRVLAYKWHLEMLNPINYNQYRMGFVPVMGELFDPLDLERGTPQAPVLAVIIDDWGYDTPAAEPLLKYPFPLTAAVLPHLVLSGRLSEKAAEAGHEVILHQPMEALESGLDLGPGGILVGMCQDEIAEKLRENLVTVAAAVGVNNHMGSRATEDYATMLRVLQAVKELGLFFVDSSTSGRSISRAVAEELGVPFGKNNFFIDNDNDVEKIKEQLRRGLAVAKQRGHAVVIGHVRPNTALALWEMIPEFLASEVDFVPISSLLEIP